MRHRPRQVLGISGSLRQESFNTRLLRHFAGALPAAVSYRQAEIGEIPLFNADALQGGGFPPKVRRLMDSVRAADAIVFATPEYNYSIPGVLKNAIDWVSRDPTAPFAGKPVAILSASTSLLGGVRAQYHLRQILVFLDAHPVNKPEVILGSAGKHFDSNGQLTDTTASALIDGLASALLQLEERLAPGRGRQGALEAAAPG